VDSTPCRHPSKWLASTLACVFASMVIVFQSGALCTGNMPAVAFPDLGNQPIVGLRHLSEQQRNGQDALAGFGDALTTGQRQLSKRPSTYQAAYITWARDTSMCLYVSGRISNETEVQLWECPVDKALITKFLIPVDIVGPVRLLEHPNYCLEAPGGVSLKISVCGPPDANRRVDQTMRFVLRPEAAYWVGYPSMDLPDERDAEHMPAHDLDAVKLRAEERGYGGFSIYQEVAWLKDISGISRGDLHWMGQGDPCVFYVHREHDVTISPALAPNTCLDVQVPVSGDVDVGNGQTVVMSECRKVESENKVTAMHFVPQVVQLDDKQWQRLRPLLELPGSASPTSLKVVMIITNVEYALMQEEDKVFDAFARIIKETLAASAGIGPDSVTSMFSAGSVRVDSELVMPPGSSVDAQRARLQEDDGMTGRLLSALQMIPGIDRVTTGKIGIHIVQQVAERPTTASPSAQLLGVLIVGVICLPLIFVACLVTFCCCGRMHKSESKLDLLQAETPEGKEPNESSVVLEETTAFEKNSDADSTDTLDMSGQPDVWRMGRVLHYRKLDGQPAAYDVLLDGRGSPARYLQDGLDSGHAPHALDVP